MALLAMPSSPPKEIPTLEERLVSRAFLVTPGVLTDVVGLVLLVPPARRGIRGIVRRGVARAVEKGTIRVHVHGSSRSADPPKGRSGEVIEGDDYEVR